MNEAVYLGIFVQKLESLRHKEKVVKDQEHNKSNLLYLQITYLITKGDRYKWHVNTSFRVMR